MGKKRPSPYGHYINILHRVEHTEEIYKEFIAILGKAAKEVKEYMSCLYL